MGIKSGADLKKIEREELIRRFGKVGNYYYNIVHGKDDRPVNPHRVRKSIGQERTLSIDIDNKEEMLEILKKLAEGVERIMKKKSIKGRTVTLKVKYYNFKSITRSITVTEPVCEAAVMMKYVAKLLEKTGAGEKKVRLLGISLSNFSNG